MNTRRVLRIAVTSPRDVTEERQSLETVVEELNFTVAADRELELCLVRWDPETIPNAHDALPLRSQDAEMRGKDVDILIGVFWNQLSDEKAAGAGSLEHEIRQAIRAREQHGRPLVMLYFKTATRILSSDFDVDQSKKVAALKDVFSTEGVSWSFSSRFNFERLVRNSLTNFILRQFPTSSGTGTSAVAEPDDPPRRTLAITPGEGATLWDALQLRASKANRHILGLRYREKYDEQCYVLRRDVADHVARFLASDKVTTALTGKAGTGKSAFACDLVRSRGAKQLVVIHDCACLDLPDAGGIAELMARHLQLGANALGMLEESLSHDSERNVLLVFDGVNEASDKERLLAALAEFVIGIANRRIKVLLTARIPTWERIRRHYAVPPDLEYHSAGHDSYIRIDGFGDDEVENAYEQYARAYGIVTPFRALSEQARYFLAQPLLLRLAVEAFRRQRIPSALDLRDVFAAYVLRCVGQTEPPSLEYAVLRRVVALMCARFEGGIPYSVLQQDPEIGEYCRSEKDSPFGVLLDVGMLSCRTVKTGLLRTDDVVFVTHERVFEFLVADSMIPSVSVESVLRNLELALEHSFPQLRGATELALSFAILRQPSQASILLDILADNRPGTRQLLCDVTQTLHDSGYPALARSIVQNLTGSAAPAATLVALQAAYQLRLDDVIVSLAVSRDVQVRDIATLYLYERWNAHRIAGSIDGGYELLGRLRPYLRTTQFARTISTVGALSLYLLRHVIDDPASLKPLVSFYRSVLGGLRGVSLDPTHEERRGVGQTLLMVVVKAFSPTLLKVMPGRAAFAEIFNRPEALRAILDIGSVITMPSLVDHMPKVLELIGHPHPLVQASSKSVLLHQAYAKPAEHFELLQQLLDEPSLSLPARGNVLWAMIYSLVTRLLRDETSDATRLSELANNLKALWFEEALSPDRVAGRTLGGERWLLEYNLFGILLIEAITQRRAGRTEGSAVLVDVFLVPELAARQDLEVALKAIEDVAHQGYVEYAVATLTGEEVRSAWLRCAFDLGVRVLANIRALNQDAVDEVLRRDPSTEALWSSVRACETALDPTEFWKTSYRLWVMVGTGVNKTIMKFSGMSLLALAQSKSEGEYLERTIRDLLTVLFDPEVLDILHIQYGLAHDPGWDLFAELEIPRELVAKRPEVHEYYRRICETCVATLGKGSMYQ